MSMHVCLGTVSLSTSACTSNFASVYDTHTCMLHVAYVLPYFNVHILHAVFTYHQMKIGEMDTRYIVQVHVYTCTPL